MADTSAKPEKPEKLEKPAKKQKKTKLLFCLNDRGAGRRSCAASGADGLRRQAKELVADDARIKVKKSDCLGLCKHGPVIEILPAKLYCQVRDAATLARLMKQVANGETISAGLISTGKSAKKR